MTCSSIKMLGLVLLELTLNHVDYGHNQVGNFIYHIHVYPKGMNRQA